MTEAPHPQLRVSVVIPVLDDAVELRDCLRLLSTQSVAPFEVVVVDNGSSDSSRAVAEAAGARVVHEPRHGIPYAAAAGYDAARGDVIARLDADSRPRPDWVATVLDAFTDAEVDAVTGVGVFHDVGRWVRWPVTVMYLGAYYLPTWAALGQPPLWGSSMAMRRSVWEGARSQVTLDADVHDDMDLAFVVGPRPGVADDGWARTVLDLRLRADVSGRSVVGWSQWRRRWARGARTVRLGFAVAPAWARWQARLARPGRARRVRRR